MTDETARFAASKDAIAARMLALAISRLGTEVAEGLRPAIAELAADAARVQLHPLESQYRPAFYLNGED